MRRSTAARRRPLLLQAAATETLDRRDPVPGHRPEGRRTACAWCAARWRRRRCSIADPAAQARALRRRRASDWLHVVDLNGAFAGQAGQCGGGRGASSTRSRLPVQLGGGIRDLRARSSTGSAAASRGSSSAPPRCENPDAGAARRAADFPAASPSASTRARAAVAVEGWAETSDVDGARPGARASRMPASAAIIYTDIDRDGVLTGRRMSTATAALGARGRDCR